MQTHHRNTLFLIVGDVLPNSKQSSSHRPSYRGAARWRACLLSITYYYVTWVSCKCSIFVITQHTETAYRICSSVVIIHKTARGKSGATIAGGAAIA